MFILETKLFGSLSYYINLTTQLTYISNAVRAHVTVVVVCLSEILIRCRKPV
jgi:hypothetical protein